MSQKQELRDSSGRLLAIINTLPGRQEIRSSNGNLLGSYNPQEDKTRTPNGNQVGSGNQLASLINRK